MPRRPRDPRSGASGPDLPTPATSGSGRTRPRPPRSDGPTIDATITDATVIEPSPTIDATVTDVGSTISAQFNDLPGISQEAIEELRGEADPLALLPLRLEYRVVEGRGRAPGEIIFRWYPDDGFAELGIDPPTDDEVAALEVTRERLDGRDWWATDDAEVVGIFASFAQEVGAARAVSLLRDQDVDNGDPDDRRGRIALLPRAVTLFAVGEDDELTKLGTGKDIKNDVNYSAALFEDDHWFLDIDKVVARGMGLRLDDADLVRKALAAEWIVAVGLHAKDAVADLESLVSDGIANGTFAFLRQDGPTNNGDGRAGHELSPHRDLAAFHNDATEHERGSHTESLRQASDLLAEAFGMDPQVLHPAVRSADTSFDDARAMLRIVLPALLEELPYVATELGTTDSDDVIDFLANWMSARGPLPAVRIGHEPYGILPVTRLSELQPLPDDDDTDQHLQHFFRGYAQAVGRRFSALARDHVPVIEPGDRDAAAALEEALKIAPVSRRIDVATPAGDIRPIACPYVTHRDHDPATYLEQLRTTALDELPDPDVDDRSTPLLYRLARRSATRRVAALGQFIQIAADERLSARVDTVFEQLGETDLHLDPDISGRLGGGIAGRVAGGDIGARVTGRITGRNPVEPGGDDADSDDAGDDTDGDEAPPADASIVREVRISERLLRGAEAGSRGFEPVVDANQALSSLGSLQSSSVAALADTGTLQGFDAGIVARLQRFTRGYGSALRHLQKVAARPDGDAQLESLLFEAVDLVQHRADAWATGLAYRRLAARRRRAELEGLRGGYYGLIGRLRPTSATAETDGYLQAPSPEQATTAAVLRAAHLRFDDEGAFDIDLSSSRVRRALGLYQLVQRGLSLEEILGLSGERWLHDRQLDRLIAGLRTQFPMRNPDDDEQVEIRLFDGRRFLDDTSLSFADADDRSTLRELQAALADDLDALADLVMAEAVHQRVQGNPDAAHAWLQVLSGDIGPGEPTFQRIHRKGHASAHAVILLVSGTEPRTDASPRELAEPSLAAAVEDALPDLADLRVTVMVDPSDDQPGGTHELWLDEDLGMTAWDLVVGGEDELKLRAIATFLGHWQRDAELREAFGPAPHSLHRLSEQRRARIEIGDGDGSPAAALHQALTLRRAIASGRPLQVTDLYAAAPAGAPLTEADVIARLSEATAALSDRAAALRDHLDTLRSQLGSQLDAALVHARNLQQLQNASTSPGEVSDEATELRSAERVLVETLIDVSRTTEPRALLMTASTGLRDDPDRFEEDGQAVLDHLTDERDRLERALTTPTDGFEAATEARAAIRELIAALRGALDGEALPVLAPLSPVGSTRPVLEGGGTARDRLGPWIDARPGVQRSVAVAEVADLKVFAVGAASTTDDLDDYDVRDATLNPPSRFDGTVLSPVSDPAAHEALAGVVIDEWSESTPSRQQMTGMAINHDAPRNEAPNAILLCEPPAAGHRRWSTEQAAGMVVETIGWMKARALTTEYAAPTGPLLWGCNQVVMQGTGDDATPRVPWSDATLRMTLADGIVAGDAQFVVSDEARTAFTEAISRRRR